MPQRSVRSGLAALVAGLVLATTAFAQELAPEQVLRRSLAAGKAGDWPGYAALMHPEALASLMLTGSIEGLAARLKQMVPRQ